MQYFVQQLINGLTLGSIYGLIAIGYTMVYGIIGMINFAHGDIFMVGAFTALIVFLILGALFYSVPVVVALLIMMIVAKIETRIRKMIRAMKAPIMKTSPCAKLIMPMMP